MHEPKPPQKITVLGAGAWGTAVAIALAARHDVLLWGRNPAQMAQAANARENTEYLPGFPFPDGLNVTADFDAAVAHVVNSDGEAPLLIDMETGEALETSPDYARSEYRPKMAAHIQDLRERSEASGLDYFLLRTDRPLDGALREYFSVRQGRM